MPGTVTVIKKTVDDLVGELFHPVSGNFIDREFEKLMKFLQLFRIYLQRDLPSVFYRLNESGMAQFFQVE